MVQMLVVDGDLEVMGATGLVSLGGGGARVGRGAVERTLRITPGEC